MSPLDDELRDALHARTSSITSSPDLFAGIEHKARRMRRRRAAGAVAGSALAVSALGLGGPLVASTLTGGQERPAPPVAADSVRDVYVLDPADPWAFRGDPAALADGGRETFAREFAVRRGVADDDVTWSPLFGQVDAPSGRAEVVFVATVDVTGQAFWGVVQSSEAGPEFLLDVPLADRTTALPAVLTGEGAPWLLVVASPAAGRAEYAPDAVRGWTAMRELAQGVAITPLDGDPSTDRLRVLAVDGEEVFAGPAPQQAPSLPPTGEPTAGAEPPQPSNVVDWPVRGSVEPDLLERAVTEFARSTRKPRELVGARLLYGGERDGRAYVLLQGWSGGAGASTFAWSYERATSMTEASLQGTTPPAPAVLAAQLRGVLLVVPEPRAGQVLYAADGTTDLQPVPDQGTEVAVLVERPQTRTGDRLLVLDGDGDPDRPVYRGSVSELLAAMQ